MSPAGDRAWVTTSAADGTSPGHLVRVPLATGATHAIAVGVQPMRVALSPDGSRAYVTNFRSGTVSVVDTATETVIATPGAGGQVDGLAVSPDGSKAYVADSSGDRIGVLDTATNAVRTNAIDPGGVPRAIAFTPDGAKAYVIVQDAGVRRIDAATDTM
ncbi:MAG: YncE family protein, partial [Solirubrobacteraceae bacterium]